ncbi:MAG: hypothetical protein V4651_06730 [Bacteroidota bacterium]
MKPTILYFITALIFCFFLGFIDEGYYSLKTFESFGNILVLLVYTLFFWGVQLGVHWLLRNVHSMSMSTRKTIVILVGLFVPLIIILALANPAK